MAYFRDNEPAGAQNMPYTNGPQEGTQQASWAEYQADDEDDLYDDGFDQLTDDGGEDDVTEEEKKEMRNLRFQTVFDISNLTATIIGAVLILLLLHFLFNMIDFVKTDFEMNFSLLMSRL